jgi:CHAT domain-containing protein/uncharacterized protein HemY
MPPALCCATALLLLGAVPVGAQGARSTRSITREIDSLRRAGNEAFSRDGPDVAIRIWRRAFDRASATSDTSALAALSANMGTGFAQLGRHDSAGVWLERARRLAESSGNLRVQANAIAELAGIRQALGDLAAARTGYLAAIQLRERAGDARGLAADYNNLGTVALAIGDPGEARRLYERALALNRRDGRRDAAATNAVNIADLDSDRGDFSQATALYRDALATFRSLGMWVDVADVMRRFGEMYLRRGDYPEAEARLRDAVARFGRAGLVHPQVDALLSLAGALAARGQLQRALDATRRARLLVDSAAPSFDAAMRGRVALVHADLALQLNEYVDAARHYRHAHAQFQVDGDVAGTANALHGLGVVAQERGDLRDAAAHLQSAHEAQRVSGSRRSAALTRVAMGELAWRTGDTAQARLAFRNAIAELTDVGDMVGAAYALSRLGDLDATMGLPAAAEEQQRSGLVMLRGREAPDVEWRLRAGLAQSLHHRGATDSARVELRLALAAIERSTTALGLDRRASFRADKTFPYARLAQLEASRGAIRDAFDVTERLRARSMADLLAHGRVAPTADTAPDLLRREQDLRHRIRALSHDDESSSLAMQLLRGPTLAVARGAEDEALTRAREAYAALWVEMRERTPGYAHLVAPEPLRSHAIAARLRAGEALVEYLLSDEGSMAFVLTRDTIAAVPLAGSRRDIARLVEFARAAIERRPSHEENGLWRAPLERLHALLVGPLDATGVLAGIDHLVVVPHLELHYLPFAALLDGRTRRFLVERFTLGYSPSASLLVELEERASSARIGTGAVAFAPKPQALPASRTEVASVRAAEPGRLTAVRIGSDASEAAFRRDAAGGRRIHLATYGVLNKQNPLFSYVELAPGGGHDGRLEVHEVLGMRLNAELVVLSACQTALASALLTDVPAGDDWIGLTRAFLHAGASQVVSSLWAVEDRATGRLMQGFWQKLDEGGRVEIALALSQRRMISDPALSHPFYWAGFVAVGRGRP